jgi:hypothetical protein
MDMKDGLIAAAIVGLGYLGIKRVTNTDSWDGATGNDFRKYNDMLISPKDREDLLHYISNAFHYDEHEAHDYYWTIEDAKRLAVSQINWFAIDKHYGDVEQMRDKGFIALNRGAESFSAWDDKVTVNCYECTSPMEIAAWMNSEKMQKRNVRHLCAKCSPPPQGLINRMGAESFEATEWWNRQSATGHERYGDEYGGFYIPHDYTKEMVQEIFKDWKPKAHPYEKRITQDSFGDYCSTCGKIEDKKKLVHYQFYLPQSNSRRNRMRYVSGGYCTNDSKCGSDLCEDCIHHSDDNNCEQCGEIMCSECARDSQYHTGDRLCDECLPEEYQAESISTFEIGDRYNRVIHHGHPIFPILEVERRTDKTVWFRQISDIGRGNLIRLKIRTHGPHHSIEYVHPPTSDLIYAGNTIKNAESHAYSYAYNEGHSDSRKTGEYHPSLSGPKQEGDFKRILKQKGD